MHSLKALSYRYALAVTVAALSTTTISAAEPQSGGAVSNSSTAPTTQTQNVNVVNTPTVAIGNTPNVAISGTPTVTVGNAVTVNEAAHTPVHWSSGVVFTPADGLMWTDNYPVPAGNRLTVESIYVNCYDDLGGLNMVSLIDHNQYPGYLARILPTPHRVNPNTTGTLAMETIPVRAVLEPGALVGFQIWRWNPSAAGECGGGFNGYLTPLP